MTCQLYKLHWFVTFFCSSRFSFFLRLHCAQLQSSSVCIRQQVDSHTRLTEKWSLYPSQECSNCLFSLSLLVELQLQHTLKCHWTTTGEMLLLPPPSGSCVALPSVLTVVTDMSELKLTSNPSMMMDKGLDGGQCGEAFTVSLLHVIRNTK